MRADYTNKVQKDKNPRGRDSIRIETVNAYPDGVIVIGDIAHMPEGCATWPAFWTLSRAGPWPNGGEVDIVEGLCKITILAVMCTHSMFLGVNLNTNNLASLHTTPDCAMDPKRVQTGYAYCLLYCIHTDLFYGRSSVSENCDSRVDYNRGCGTSFSSPKSYGRGFNDCGGGYFVMQKSLQDGVKIWFWSRNDPKIPTEVSDLPAPGRSISTANFGVPSASFPMGDQCDFASHFDPHRIVINLTFCVSPLLTFFAYALLTFIAGRLGRICV
jgi:hypothetical protein